jgi:hypothetical protein
MQSLARDNVRKLYKVVRVHLAGITRIGDVFLDIEGFSVLEKILSLKLNYFI